MDDARRRKLVRRRIAVREQREAAAAEARRRAFLAPLDEAAIDYTFVDDDAAVRWLEDRFAFGSYSALDWDQHAIHEAQVRPAALGAWLRALATTEDLGDPMVHVVFAEVENPALALRYDAFVANIDTMMDLTPWNMWIFDPLDDWVAEFHHDDVARFMRSKANR